MFVRLLGVLVVASMLAGGAAAQSTPAKAAEPVSDGRPLSEWVEDLKAPAPQTRNAAAYEIAGMGPAAVAAVPDLIVALDDQIAAVRYPAIIALMEIGPAAKAAIPKLEHMEEEEINDEIAAAARRALKRIRVAPEATPR
jgi:HEAT repeat protein